MATEIPVLRFSLVTAAANADFSAKQFYVCKMSASPAKTILLPTAVTDRPIGIVQNDPGLGKTASILVSGISKFVAGGNIAVGDNLGLKNDGTLVKVTPGTDTTVFLVGVAIEAGVSGDILTGVFSFAAAGRAA